MSIFDLYGVGSVGGITQNSNTNIPDLTSEQIDSIKDNAPKGNDGKLIFDHSKAMGSPENPIVVGMPEYSDVLVYDGKRKLWLLTDGLGNGWIR